MLAMLKVCPPSDELVKAAPAMVFPPWPKVPLNWANQETYTSPFGPIAMFGPWLLHTLLIFIGALNVAPPSVDRDNRISLQPRPWKSDHAAETLPVASSTWIPCFSLKKP